MAVNPGILTVSDSTLYRDLPEYSDFESHCVQLCWPFSEKVFLSHIEQDTAPSLLNVPFLHLVHSDVKATPTNWKHMYMYETK